MRPSGLFTGPAQPRSDSVVQIMGTEVTALLGAAAELRFALTRARLDPTLPGAREAGSDTAAMIRQLDDHVMPRLGNLDAPALVVIGGSTGSGKSLLTNSVLGADVTRPGYLRPTTMAPVLVHDPSDAAWFQGGHVLPNLARVLQGEAHGHRELRLVASNVLPDGVALLDSPDIDSVSVENRTLAAELLAAADLWIFVTTAARYADAVPWDFLEKAQRQGTPLVIVMNRVPAEGAAPLAEHLAQMLAEQHLAGTPIVTVAEQELQEGRLPAESVAPLREWLDRLGNDREARDAAIRRSLQGSMGDLANRADTVAAALDRQSEAIAALREDVRAAYSTALEEIRSDIEQGNLMRGEVLARWEELLGTGEVFRQLRSGLGRVRDQVTGLFTGRRKATAELNESVESAVQTLIRTRGDAAAADVARRWRARPGGEQLVAGDEHGTLARSSPELDTRAAAAVRAWQGELLELVRNVGGDKKSTARILSFGVNGTAAAVMFLVFSQTGGLTGAEAAIAGGASAVGHALLEALLGDQAIRSLAAKARAALIERAGEVYAAEAARYDDVLASIDVAAELPEALRRSARTLAEGVLPQAPTRPAGGAE